jgi:hypothetical protein
MINFATLQALDIPEGKVVEIKDAFGRVIWAVQNSKPVILQVAKVTSDTYAGETTYTGEQFILLDIYPKTNGTVKVTYGGLTKTITDTSGAENPNAQGVYFGTFNGVSDSVTTPTSGTLTISGDCVAFACGWYTSLSGKSNNAICYCVIAIENFGSCETIPSKAFQDNTALKSVGALDGITSIGSGAFGGCTSLENMIIPSELNFTPAIFIDDTNGYPYGAMDGSFLIVDENHPTYSYEGSCFITKADSTVVFGFSDAAIPSGVTSIAANAFRTRHELSPTFTIPEGVKTIGEMAFYNAKGITDLTIPSSVTNIGQGAFYGVDALERVVVLATTPPTAPSGASTTYMFNKSDLVSITVPKGCGAAYKSAAQWKNFADYIVEAS